MASRWVYCSLLTLISRNSNSRRFPALVAQDVNACHNYFFATNRIGRAVLVTENSIVIDIIIVI